MHSSSNAPRGIPLPWSTGLKYHFFLSHTQVLSLSLCLSLSLSLSLSDRREQANGGQTMAWLEGKLSGRDLHSWYLLRRI